MANFLYTNGEKNEPQSYHCTGKHPHERIQLEKLHVNNWIYFEKVEV